MCCAAGYAYCAIALAIGPGATLRGVISEMNRRLLIRKSQWFESNLAHLHFLFFPMRADCPNDAIPNNIL